MKNLETILKEDGTLLEKHTIEEFEQVKYGFDDSGISEALECYLEFVEQIKNGQVIVQPQEQSAKKLIKTI